MKRWKITVNTPSGWVMVEHAQGDYYLASDVAELERRYREVVELLRRAQTEIRHAPCRDNEARSHCIRCETKDAVDKFLAEEDA